MRNVGSTDVVHDLKESRFFFYFYSHVLVSLPVIAVHDEVLCVGWFVD